MSGLARGNLFAALPEAAGEEHFDDLPNSGDVRIERIVSHGQCSPEGFWYDQDGGEWVVLLRGRARLEVEGRDATLDLRPGDYVDLPAHTRHRIAWTAPDEPTVWLAIHY